jgi:hypothetical protein
MRRVGDAACGYGASVTGQQRGPQDAAHLLGEIVAEFDLECFDVLLQQPA